MTHNKIYWRAEGGKFGNFVFPDVIHAGQIAFFVNIRVFLEVAAHGIMFFLDA